MLIDPIGARHLPLDDLAGADGLLGQVEGFVVGALGAVGVDLLGGRQQLDGVGVHAFAGAELLPGFVAHEQRDQVGEAVQDGGLVGGGGELVVLHLGGVGNGL